MHPMIRPALLLTAATALATPLFAQAPAAAPGSAAVELQRPWTQVSTYLARSAAAVPESSYAYKPTPAVRSFGQLVAHVAGAQRMFCAAALGDKPASEDDLERTAPRAKADFVRALEESNAYCARAYALPSARLAETIELFGGRRTRGSVLLMNVTHDYEHYGNVVTYLRLLGLVPPSSQPSS